MRAVVLFIGLALGAEAPHGHAQHAHHGHRAAEGDAAPTEGGEAAFTAIAEIVALLAEDDATDWESVDIDGLRAHLVDMSLLTLHASVMRLEEGETIRFVVSGEAEVVGAVQRMTIAHAPFLERLEEWEVAAEPTVDGAVLSIRSEDPALRIMARGLGFFGLMAMGAHHPEHHLAIARGAHVH